MSKPTRTRLPAATRLTTREEAEIALEQFASFSLLLNQEQSAMELEIHDVRARHALAMETCRGEITRLTADLREWLLANPDQLTGHRKSIEMLHGRIGYRTGTPKLKTLAGYTFDRVREKLIALPWGAAFLRTKTEVDKESILAAASQGSLASTEVAAMGCKIVQEETFFVEPRIEPDAAPGAVPLSYAA